jgi:hypothetical protein
MWFRAIWRSLIPGVGQIRHGNPRTGLLYFVLFTLSLNIYLILPILLRDRVPRYSVLAIVVLLWLISFVDNLGTIVEEHRD